MVQVRFAPSPTGFLHIGSARSALFNWLFARHEAGKFLLRIEDTDKARSKDEFLDEILGSLKWLGMDWDEEPYYQSRRLELYNNAAQKLMEEGKAYADGGAIRFRMPKKKIAFYDIVRGEIIFDSDVLKDEVLIKSDGFPTYNFACVVDDADMKITHVIRGDDHISNTPKQIALYGAMGCDAPKFAHIPLIMGPDGGRMSKRHDATSIMEYKAAGYLPEALVNFLSLMGWSPKDNREILSRQDLIKNFTLEKVNKTSAIFNVDKLDWLNGQYIKNCETGHLLGLLLPFLRDRQIIGADFDGKKLLNLIELYKTRMRTLSDFAGHITVFYTDKLDYDEAAVNKHLRAEGTRPVLERWRDRLVAIESFDHEALEKACAALAQELGVKTPKLIHPTRVAITGRTVGAGLFETMEAMGRDTVIKRLDFAINMLAG